MNTNLISTVRAEIERRMNGNPHYVTYKELESILSFLSDLEKSEKPINHVLQDFPTTEKEMQDFLATHERIPVPERLNSLERILQEKPVCEDLEEEFKKYWDEMPPNTILDKEAFANTARHFAQWGAEHATHAETTNDLEEAAEKEYPCDKSWMTPDMLDLNAHKQVAFRKGAKWDRQQMMKEAVEGEVVKDINNRLAVTAKNVNLDKFKFGEKVRIIIVKED